LDTRDDRAHRLFTLWTLLRQTYTLLVKNQERALADFDLNMAQYMTLFMIKHSTRPVTPTIIATYLSQETPSVTYGLDKLEKKGLIRRVQPGSGDRREIWIEPTETGAELLRRASSAAWEPVEQLSTDLTDPEQLDALFDALLILRNRGAEVSGASKAALDFALEHLRHDPLMWGPPVAEAKKGRGRRARASENGAVRAEAEVADPTG
jgi:DNA-binding MarR family transcriptional regulator